MLHGVPAHVLCTGPSLLLRHDGQLPACRPALYDAPHRGNGSAKHHEGAELDRGVHGLPQVVQAEVGLHRPVCKLHRKPGQDAPARAPDIPHDAAGHSACAIFGLALEGKHLRALRQVGVPELLPLPIKSRQRTLGLTPQRLVGRQRVP